MKQMARHYHEQRDHLQDLLTRRVLEVRGMHEKIGGMRQTIRRLQRHLVDHVADTPIMAISMVFGPYATQAVSVSRCETGGTFDVNAQNGQYLGLFQMGSYARSRYGHSNSALGQAQAAYRYFVDSGKDWSPWECRP